MKLYKVQFSKFGRGKTYFERSIPWTSVQLLLILSDEVRVMYKKNKNRITFTFYKPEVNTWARIINVPDYLAKTILPMEDWKQF